jgi:hypothetical protein
VGAVELLLEERDFELSSIKVVAAAFTPAATPAVVGTIAPAMPATAPLALAIIPLLEDFPATEAFRVAAVLFVGAEVFFAVRFFVVVADFFFTGEAFFVVLLLPAAAGFVLGFAVGMFRSICDRSLLFCLA